MAITLNGTTGIDTPAVTNNGAYTGDGISFADATPSNTLVTTTGGNVGIGTASPSQQLDVTNGARVNYLQIRNGGYAGSAATTPELYSPSSATLVFGAGGAERMRIDNSGNLMVGTTSSASNSGAGAKVQVNSGIGTCVAVVGSASTNADECFKAFSTGVSLYRFYVDWGGTIHATSTSIAAISDESLKENIKDLETGLTEVMALKPRRFDWKNGDATNVAGFVAQEIETVLPDLVTEQKYTQDEDGNDITKKSLKMGDMIPTLVKAIQEQQAIISDLKARIETLENK